MTSNLAAMLALAGSTAFGLRPASGVACGYRPSVSGLDCARQGLTEGQTFAYELLPVSRVAGDLCLLSANAGVAAERMPAHLSRAWMPATNACRRPEVALQIVNADEQDGLRMVVMSMRGAL